MRPTFWMLLFSSTFLCGQNYNIRGLQIFQQLDPVNLRTLDTFQDSVSGIDSIPEPAKSSSYHAQIEVLFLVSDTANISRIVFDVISRGHVLQTLVKTFDQKRKSKPGNRGKRGDPIPLRFELGSLQLPLSVNHLRVKLYNGHQLLAIKQRKI